jgi:hypothetical protein
LLEVIVSAAVMTLFTTMVAHAVVVAYRSHGKMADRITNYRRACAAGGMLAREMQACDRLYSPLVGQWRFDEPFSPTLAAAFTAADFPTAPLAPGESEQGRILMRTVERFDITHLNRPSPRSCRLSAQLTNVTTPVMAEVSVTQW